MINSQTPNPQSNILTEKHSVQRAIAAHLEALQSWGVKRVQSGPEQSGPEQSLAGALLASSSDDSGDSSDFEDFSNFDAQLKSCVGCQLATSRRGTLLGEGPLDAQLFIVLAAAGSFKSTEPAGAMSAKPSILQGLVSELFDKILSAMGLDRSEVYMTAPIKCLPDCSNSASGLSANDSSALAIEACSQHLRRQILRIRPRVIVALGEQAHQMMELSAVALAVAAVSHTAIPVIKTYHPEQLLQQPQLKAVAWDDLQAVISILR